MPQPGAVRVIFTSTMRLPSSRGFRLASYTRLQVDDVERDFRVEAGAQLAPDHGLDLAVAGIGRQCQLRRRLLADGVGVLPGDAEQVAFDEDGVAATGPG